MVEINTIIILKTPYHQKSIEHLFPMEFNSEKTLLLYMCSLVVSNYKCNKWELSEYDFSRKQIFKNPLKFTKPFRKKIRDIDTEIAEIKEKYSFSKRTRIFLGSDKDIFTQLFLTAISQNTAKLIAVDEGLGFYVKLTFKDYVIASIYKLLTPVLFGKRLFFIKRLGTLPGINTVYLRNIDLLPSKSKGIEYVEFQMKSTQLVKPLEKGMVLFFSFPEQDLQYDSKKKIALHLSIAKYLQKQGRKLIIKPHPRENVAYLQQNLTLANIKILDESQLGETLQYFNYEFIINVFSSVILDIIDSNYPKNKLLTLGYTDNPPMKFDKELRYIPLSNFEVEKHLLLEKT